MDYDVTDDIIRVVVALALIVVMILGAMLMIFVFYLGTK